MAVSPMFAIGQQIENPTEGKSLVYFARTSELGGLINFKYFDGDIYLGKFSGRNYMVYECDPGEHVFWSASENRSFVQADLEEGGTYIIIVRPKMGAVKSAVKLIPISPGDTNWVGKFDKLISDLPAVEPDLSDSNEYDFFIKNGLEKYYKDLEKGKSFDKLTREMYHNKVVQ